MGQKKKLTANEKNLVRRYLIWCYKTTKEDLDRIDRYFTQYIVDQFLIDQLRQIKEYKTNKEQEHPQVQEFKAYMDNKYANVLKKKFADEKREKLLDDYQYLSNRFKTIEKAIQRFLGKKDLSEIELLYEGEMTRRILAATEHK